ncbi:MAG: MFS transporter, partial [Burkholderiaceae bacterium]
ILTRIEAEATASGAVLARIPEQAVQVPVKTTLGSLFKPPLLRKTFVAICVQVAINVVIYGFIVWVPVFLIKQGMALGSSLGYTTLMALGGPAGALLGVWLADKVGRKNGLIAVSLIAAVIGWLYSHSASIELATSLGFVLFTLTYLMVALGVATYVPELFPTENRMRGNGVANVAGRVAGIVAPQAIVAMYAFGGIKDVLLIIIGTLLVLVVVLAAFGVETNQLSLEAISRKKR